jgi:hypothetical protein
MIPARSSGAFAITFAAAYAVLYVLSIEYNLALFTYHPATGEFYPFVKPAADQPAMYWYGWLATSTLGALAIAAIASSLPVGLTARVHPAWSWAVPMAAMLVFSYILRGYFIR